MGHGETIPDLIETLWNVKDMSCRTRSPESRGFNRDIVECKGGCVGERVASDFDLIETLWNVKSETR